MRVNVEGPGQAAKNLKSLLCGSGFHLTSLLAAYTVSIEETTSSTVIIVDGVASALESEIVNHIEKSLAQQGLDGLLALKRIGGNRDDSRINLMVPKTEALQAAIEIGIMRALVTLARKDKPRWWKKTRNQL